MKKINSNRIIAWKNGFYCNVCGRHEEVSPCRLTLEFAYGSRFDGERLALDLCGECADRILKKLSEENQFRHS